MSTLKIKIPIKNFGKQRCAEGFNLGVKGIKKEQKSCGYFNLHHFKISFE
jgi:hypothetical protein